MQMLALLLSLLWPNGNYLYFCGRHTQVQCKLKHLNVSLRLLLNRNSPKARRQCFLPFGKDEDRVYTVKDLSRAANAIGFL